MTHSTRHCSSMRRLVSVTTLAALLMTTALVAFGGTAAPAHAGDSVTITTKGGKVKFFDRGDRIAADDKQPDGYGVRAYLR